MTTITINDLVDSKDLDQSAMATILGGHWYHRGHWHYRRITVYRPHWTRRRGWHVHKYTFRVKSFYHRGHWHR